MRKKPKVTIGIPAYNEEANIGNLLRALLTQKTENYRLSQILVVSDASTDKTDKIVKSFKNKRIRLIRFERRRGQCSAQNRILNESSTDILVLIEADTLPFDETTIQKLVTPLLSDKSLCISVGQAIAVKPDSFIEKVLYRGQELKADVFDEWKGGLNIYSTRGQAMRALTYEFYKNLKWPSDVPEDSYVYLRLKGRGMGMILVEEAKIYFRLPSKLKDRIRNNGKFYTGKSTLYKYFPKDLLECEYKIPIGLITKKTLNHFFKSPLWTTLALGEAVLMKIINGRKTGYKSIHQSLLSTKYLIS